MSRVTVQLRRCIRFVNLSAFFGGEKLLFHLEFQEKARVEAAEHNGNIVHNYATLVEEVQRHVINTLKLFSVP